MKKNEILLKLTSGFSIIITTILVIIKAIAWILTGSLAILSSLVDSCFDLMTSSINFFAIKYSLKPKDKYHKFGHEAIKDISCLLQASFISGSAIFVMFQSVKNLILKERLYYDNLGVIMMLMSLFFKLCLISVQKYTIRKTKSSIIHAESLNYISDVFMDSSVIISLIIIKYTGFYYIDSIIAIVLSLLILRASFKIGKRAFDNIMCKELPVDKRKIIIKIIKESKGVKGYHNLKTRMSGSKCFIQVHLDMDKKLRLEQSGEITKSVIKKIRKILKNCEIIIHQEAV